MCVCLFILVLLSFSMNLPLDMGLCLTYKGSAIELWMIFCWLCLQISIVRFEFERSNFLDHFTFLLLLF